MQQPANYHKMVFGGWGFRKITSGFSAVANEVFGVLQVIEDTVITATNEAGGDDLDGTITFAAGTTIYGEFKAENISGVTGTVLGYLALPAQS